MNPHQALIEKGNPFVLAVAGGGSGAVDDLLSYGGMSGVLLAAHVLQSYDATREYLRSGDGADPHGVSGGTARQLALAAFREARRLSKGCDGAFGVGATSSLRKPEGEREGREHRVHIAVQTPRYTQAFTIRLKAPRDRRLEERVVSDLIVRAARQGAGIFADLRYALAREDEIGGDVAFARDGWREVMMGTRPYASAGPLSRYCLPSSCNPLHEGHRGMIRWCDDNLGGPVDVEICIANADKPPLDYLDLEGRTDGVPRVIVSNTGLFADKSESRPGTTFLVGTDTILRVGDRRFAGGDGESLLRQVRRIEESGGRFLVFDRPGVRFDGWEVPPALWDLCTFVGAAKGYNPSPISSTRLREEAARAAA